MLLLNTFVRLSGFSDWAKLDLSPLNNLSSTEFHCPITISTLDFSWLMSGRWRIGAPPAYSPPTSHSHASGSGAFVIARGSVLCTHLPPHLPLSPKASQFPTADVGLCSHTSPSRNHGGVFSCAYTIAHVLRRRCEVFVAGGKSAIVRCGNTSFVAWFLFPVHAYILSFSSSSGQWQLHQGNNSEKSQNFLVHNWAN